jgi:hypothetical protein
MSNTDNKCPYCTTSCENEWCSWKSPEEKERLKKIREEKEKDSPESN